MPGPMWFRSCVYRRGESRLSSSFLEDAPCPGLWPRWFEAFCLCTRSAPSGASFMHLVDASKKIYAHIDPQALVDSDNAIGKIIDQIAEGSTVLDVGCATGYLAQ